MWGDAWGTMVWGGLAVPMLSPLGGLFLIGALVSGAWLARRRAWSTVTTSVVLVTIGLVPWIAVASQVAVPNVFQNGTAADADEVNQNFDTLVTESNAQDQRLNTLESGPVLAEPPGFLVQLMSDSTPQYALVRSSEFPAVGVTAALQAGQFLSNPLGTGATITTNAVGDYTVVFDGGVGAPKAHVQVSFFGNGVLGLVFNCHPITFGPGFARVRCFQFQ